MAPHEGRSSNFWESPKSSNSAPLDSVAYYGGFESCSKDTKQSTMRRRRTRKIRYQTQCQLKSLVKDNYRPKELPKNNPNPDELWRSRCHASPRSFEWLSFSLSYSF